MKLKATLPVKSSAKARVTHTQSIKQSWNYQAADAMYSITLECDQTDEAIRKTAKHAERLVEELLATKVAQQRHLLDKLGDGKR